MTSTPRQAAKATVMVDNARVIVTEWRFAPNAETGWHRHAYDYVVVPQTTGRLMLEGKEADATAELQAGQPYYRGAGIEHNVVNVNDHEFVFIEVELKNGR
jgi:quercetin dioxygenase-like cupin family protein